MPKLYYFTTNSSNGILAETIAEFTGVALEFAYPRDLPRLKREGAEVILDWDYLPEEQRHMLLNSMAVRVVGAHSLSFSEAMVSFLPRRGIVYGSTLGTSFFNALKAKARAG